LRLMVKDIFGLISADEGEPSWETLKSLWEASILFGDKKQSDAPEPPKAEAKSDENGLRIPRELPVLPMREAVVYPEIVAPLLAGTGRGAKLVDDAVMGDRIIALVAQRNEDAQEATPDDLYQIGTAVVIHRLLKSPDGSVRLIVQGIERIRIDRFTQTQPYLKAEVTPFPDQDEKDLEIEALMRNTVDIFQRMVGLVAQLPDELGAAAANVERPRQLVYLIATSLRMKLADRQALLELEPAAEKLKKLNGILSQELEVLELGKKLQGETQQGMEKAQREYFLREQLKSIKKELGEEDEQAAEVKEYERKIVESGMTEEAAREARRELERIKTMPSAAAEYSVIKTYLDWLVSLPWQKATDDNLDIAKVREVLDEDHYDLEKIKERILEFLAVRKLKRDRQGEVAQKGAILCFVGPPGTGKTSLGQSIARALGRKFVRMSLGGVRDEAEIRGHRRTYIGALPGRIIQGIKRSETKNPVFMLDEVDKIGADYRGDPSSALLEVLDPEQNADFRDHYLDVPFDLSQVMFITTANLRDPIPEPLLDRMEVLTLSGYTEEEKVMIAQKYLIPRQLKQSSVNAEEVEFTEPAIRAIIRDHTREAGLRNLEREIAGVCRKVATKVAQGKTEKSVVTAENLSDYLGKQEFFSEVAERTETPGVATGLAWTAAGGDILFVEATKMKGRGGLILTGKLGDVMKESATAALSYVRSRAKSLGVDEAVFAKTDIHIHVPEGAIPKDGPSAGVTMVTALVSLLTDRPVCSDVGMTGEITLRGRVLPIGGLKEKVLAAHRAGLKTIIVPRRNEKDLADVPKPLKDELTFVFVDRIDEVLAVALRPKVKAAEKAGE
jgi:ATP-dependent Lon protease